MARLTITLKRNTAEGGLEVRIALRPDEDVLPDEHERLHGELVRRLVPSLAQGGKPVPNLKVQRERPAREPVVG
jgi:hypothetical protein